VLVDKSKTYQQTLSRWRRVFKTLLLKTDVRKWQSVAKAGPPTWDERNMIIARHIPPGSSVLDLGAGAQTLRNYLPAGCTYQPCDVVANTPDVIYCDFNRGIYPQPQTRCDYVVCSGILEYIRKPKLFLSRVTALAPKLLLSYNPVFEPESKVDRLEKGWLNHLSEQQLQAMFDELGVKWKIVNRREPNEVLFLIERQT